MSDETELKVKLTAEDGITAVVERVVEALGDTKLGHAITSASVAFEAASHIIEKVEHVMEAVHQKVEEAIHAASEHETAERKIAAALMVTGQYTEEQAHKLDSMAGSLGRAAAMSGNAVRGAVALGTSLGISSNQIGAAAEAATNLAAVLDVDVSTAMRQLSVTMSGSLGRLGLIIPELKGFTESQLQNGAAIQFLNEKYKGFASTLSDTYAGAVTRSEQAHHKFEAALGEIITSSDLVRARLEAKAALYDKLTAIVKATTHWLEENADTIHRIVEAMKVAAIGYAVYFVAINAVTIATTAATLATSAFAAVMAVVTSPITLTVAAVMGLVAGLAYLGVNTDHVIGLFKILIGAALMPLTSVLTAVIMTVGAMVSIFNKDWGTAITDAGTKLIKLNASLITNGVEQMKAGEAARNAAKDHKDHADAVHHGTLEVDAHEQAMRRLAAEYSRASENAKPALDALKEFAPKLSLIDWQRDQQNFKDQIAKMKESATIVVKTITDNGGPKGGAEAAMLQKATEDVQRASAAQSAIKIKDFEFVKDNAIKNADVWIEYEKQRATTASQEIMLKKIAAAEETRAKLIDIKTQEFIAEEELQRHYLSTDEEAKKKAYDTDLNAYRQMLDTKLQLAVDHETQKAIAEDQAAQSLTGLDPVAKAETQAQLTEDVENAHQQRLTAALQNGRLSQEAYDREYQASKIAQLKASHAEEIAAHQEKAEMLGLTDEAVKERQLEAELNYKDRIEEIENDKLLSDEERKAALADQEMTHTATMNQIRETNIQNEATRANQMHDYWAEALAKVRLEQEKHGAIIGTIQGIQHTQQFQAANKALGDLSSLRNSHSKKAFEVGKAAAIAQASISTFMAATEAYAALAGIPIVGPVLGALAAAAAIAAGVVNIQQIQSQKFNAAHGGIDEVPMSLDNSTFLLKGGERVLQPSANQDMTAAAKKINEGGSGTVNVYINVYGDVPDSQLTKVKQAVIEGIRDASERGQPIINEKGIVRAG